MSAPENKLLIEDYFNVVQEGHGEPSTGRIF
jgi:hypothetical protein